MCSSSLLGRFTNLCCLIARYYTAGRSHKAICITPCTSRNQFTECVGNHITSKFFISLFHCFDMVSSSESTTFNSKCCTYYLFWFLHHLGFKERPTFMSPRLPRSNFASVHLLEEFFPSRLTAKEFFKLRFEGFKGFFQSFEDRLEM